jgi:hypothetical protein
MKVLLKFYEVDVQISSGSEYGVPEVDRTIRSPRNSPDVELPGIYSI